MFAKSFYAGAKHGSGPLSGEILGVLAASSPEEINEGMRALVRCLEADARFYAADQAQQTAVFPHVIASLGHYLSALAGLPPGASMAYLVAPPMEATIGPDMALKTAGVRAKPRVQTVSNLFTTTGTRRSKSGFRTARWRRTNWAAAQAAESDQEILAHVVVVPLEYVHGLRVGVAQKLLQDFGHQMPVVGPYDEIAGPRYSNPTRRMHS